MEFLRIWFVNSLSSLSWTGLNLFIVQIGRNLTATFSLWDLLRVTSGDGDVRGVLQGTRVGRGDAGPWGVIAIASLALTLVPLVWKSSFASVGMFAPATFKAYLAWKSHSEISSGQYLRHLSLGAYLVVQGPPLRQKKWRLK